jgi:hypothetical protein
MDSKLFKELETFKEHLKIKYDNDEEVVSEEMKEIHARLLSRDIFKQMEALKDELKSGKHHTDEEAIDIAKRYDTLRRRLLNIGSKNGSRKSKDCIE